nr:hypothetical protein [uncultured Carboxylicivirga sp.]
MFGKVIQRDYKIILPIVLGDLQSQWKSCIEQLKEIEPGSIFKISIFVGVENWEEVFTDFAHELRSIFSDKCPAYTILSQGPGRNKVSLEVGVIKDEQVKISYNLFRNTPYSLIEYNGCKELWASGLGLTLKTDNINSSAIHAFEELITLLSEEGFTLNEVVRQWNYIPEILSFEVRNEKEQQHYQLFNEVRKHYYNQYRTIEGYPAATGIGVAMGSVSIDICAIKPANNNSVYSVNNPEQLNAYHYRQDVLVGELAEGLEIKQAPQFERAKLVTDNNTLFISGTASIKGQYTIGLNNALEQTQTTLELIHNLKLAAKQTAKNLNENSLNFSYARIYIKKAEDFESVMSICTNELPNTPLNFVQADICRDNLLVEIEAEMQYNIEDTNSTETFISQKVCSHCR